jgi:hypothetical protein
MWKYWSLYVKLFVGKRPEIWPSGWMLHHDNAPAHKTLSRSFWPKNRLLKWNTHHITMILLRMTSGSLQK